MHTVIACVLMLVALVPQADDAPPPASTQPATWLRQVPQTEAAAREQLALAEARLDSLRPTTMPADDGTSTRPEQAASHEAALALFQAWERYVAELRRAVELYADLSRLRSPEHVEEITARLAEIEQKTRELKDRDAPANADPEIVAARQQELQALQSHIAVLAEQQQTRAVELATGFDARQEQLEADIEERKAAYEASVRARDGATATAPAETALADMQRRRHEVELAIAELTLRNLALRRQQAELVATRDERVLAALRQQETVLRKHVAGLVEGQGRARIARLERELARATDPAEQSLVELELFTERVMFAYFRNADRLAAIQRELPGARLSRMMERLETSERFWQRIVNSLAYRTGDEALALQHQLADQWQSLEQQAVARRQQHTRLLARLHETQDVRERVRRRFGELADEVANAARRLPTARRLQMDTEIASLRAALSDAMQKQIGEIEAGIEAVEKTLDRASTHFAMLERVDQALYWSRVASRDAGLLRADWSEAGSELAAIWRGLTIGRPEGPAATGDTVDMPDLVGIRKDSQTKAAELWSSVQGMANELWQRAGTALVIAIGVAIAVGYVLRRTARRVSVPLAREIERVYHKARRDPETHGPGISQLINLLLWNLVGDLSVPLLIIGVIASAIGWVATYGPPAQVSLTLAALVASAITLWRLVHHLFEADSPPHRPLPCRDSVARHWRWWLTAQIFFALIVLPVPLMLQTGDLALALRTTIVEVFKTGSLLMLVLFLFRKRTVLGVLDQTGWHWPIVLASVSYPVIMLGVLSLLVLQVIGFGTLVSYIGLGLILTVTLAIVAAVVSEYIVDLMQHYYRAGSLLVTERNRDPSETPEDSENRSHYVLQLARGGVRVAAAAAIIAAIVRIWRIPVDPQWVSPRLLGFGGLVIVLALVIDRVIFAAMFALQQSKRLPENTSRLIRRWLRGALGLLVVLAIVAIAGFEIDSLWTFLTTLLAMVAIGFVAVWSILSNILATIVILIWRPFNVGDEVEILPEALSGKVVDISFMYTVLRAEDGTRTSVPNNLFAQKFIARRPGRGVTRTLAEQLERDKPIE